MNILADTLPDYVTVKGVKYGINTDFRIWMEFDSIMHQVDLSTRDKIMMIMKLCIDGERCNFFPEDIGETLEALCEFYLLERKGKSSDKKERILDFRADGGYIYSAFLTQYGIDLISIPYMHWYVFSSLLEGLEEERKIIKIMRYRLCDPEREQNTERRRHLERMKKVCSLPDIRTESEKDEELANILFEAF